MSITVIGFLVTILLGLKELLIEIGQSEYMERIFTIVTFILPSLSSFLLVYWSQKGYKKKEETREEARIQCKFIVNEAKIRFAAINNNPQEYERLYNWLNEQIHDIQIGQVKNYYSVHNQLQRSADGEKV